MQIKSMFLARMSRSLVLGAILLGLPLAHLVAQEEKTWTVNFKETEITELVRFVATATGKTVVIDPKVKGKVQVVSSEPVTEDELYNLFLSILEVHGFAAVESGDVVRIIPTQIARTAPVPVVTDDPENANSEIVTQVIQLENISAARLIPVLRPLAPQQAHMAAYAASNAIIISDRAANIARIREVIESIDRTAQEETEVIPLEHASSEDVVRMLQQLQKKTGEKGAASTSQLLLVADKRTNSVLVSGDQLQRARIRELIERMDTPLAQSGNVRVIYLEYANAKDLAGVLGKIVANVEQMAGKKEDARSGKGVKASVEADEGTNALIVTADTDVMQSLLAVISRLDIRRAQVLVEAIIVEITDIDSRQLGLQWIFLDPDGGYGSSSATSLLGATTLGAADIADNDDASSLLGALATASGQVFGIADESDDLSFNAVLNALQANGDANILSTPSLLTLDNEEASITVGQNVPFVTGSFTSTAQSATNPFQTLEREDVGITLTVTPHVNEGDSLVLDISQEVSSLSPSAAEFGASDVITNERKIQTKVLAADKQIIVLGGLIEDDIQDESQKVPLLGDIPILGRLFRNSSVTVTKRHLLVFLRSTIIRDDHTLSGATAEKYRYIRDRQLEKVDGGVDLIRGAELPLLPEWEEELNA